MPHETSSKASRARKQTRRTNITSVAVVGLGYVGLPLAILASEKNFKVHGYDVDEHKIAGLKKHRAPFLSEKELEAFKKSRMKSSADESTLDGVEAFIICVPTPVDRDHTPDLAPLFSASETVGRHLQKGGLVVVESTVNPGACESVALPALERTSGLVGGRDFSFAHCPERINPGDAVWGVRTIPRVMGALDGKSLARATDLYASILDSEITPMQSLKEAEAVKMVENAFRDVNIAFVNELAMSFSKAGIDTMNVIRGASTKPFSFMPHYPGCGVGGHCIPVDPYYLIRYGRENGFVHRFLETAREINNEMPRYTVDVLEKALTEIGRYGLSGATVALLGLAYKRDVPDLRESPALVLLEELRQRGARVQVHDPLVPGESTHATLDAALAGADAALIATDHTVFRTLSPNDFLAHGIGVVIDGRNCLSKETFQTAGIRYYGIGR